MDEELYSSKTDIEHIALYYAADTGTRTVLTGFFAAIGLAFPPAAALAIIMASLDVGLTTWAQNLAANRVERSKAYLNDLLHALGRELKKLKKDLHKVEERLNAADFGRVQQNYLLAASTEPTDERLKMLAAAAAGSANLVLTVAEVARIERKIHELDPEDVKALWKIYRTVGNVDIDGRVHRNSRQLLMAVTERESTDVLDSGFLRRLPGGYGGGMTDIDTTRLGSNLLVVLEEYLRESVPDEQIPGRHPRPSDREANVVQDIIAAHSELLLFIDRIMDVGSNATVFYSLPEVKADGFYAAPPSLDISFQLDPNTSFVSSEYRNIPVDRGEFTLGYQDGLPDRGRIYGKLTIEGTHDVLRTIADARQWDWYSSTLTP